MSLRTASLSKTGGRKVNQDYCSYLEENNYGCYVLADGLGAYRGSGMAARITGKSVLKAFAASPGASPTKLREYLEYARVVFQRALQNEYEARSMKTTLLVLLTDYEQALWAHIGDSRLYYFRAGSVIYQTKDHSVPQAMVNSGDITPEEIRLHEDRNRLTRAFDGQDISRFVYSGNPAHLNQGDAFLLCSDGFWEYVYETEMEEDLSISYEPQGWLFLMEERLLRRAEPKHDNYSALAIIV